MCKLKLVAMLQYFYFAIQHLINWDQSVRHENVA